MNFRHLIPALFFFSTAAVQAELHEFRNAAGQTIRAEILSATSEQITIKLENGRTMLVNNSMFIKEDQDYIHEWMASHPAQLKLKVRFEKKPEDEEVDDTGSVVTTSELLRYDIHIGNADANPVTGCEVHYLIFKSKGGIYSSNANQGGFDELPEYLVQWGSSQLEDLPPNGSTTIISDLIIVNDFEPKGGGKDAEEDLMGLWIRVLNDRKQIVFEAKSNEAKLKNVTWFDPYAKTGSEDE